MIKHRRLEFFHLFSAQYQFSPYPFEYAINFLHCIIRRVQLFQTMVRYTTAVGSKIIMALLQLFQVRIKVVNCNMGHAFQAFNIRV